MKRTGRHIAWVLWTVALLSVASCRQAVNLPDEGRRPIAAVDGHFLYEDELLQALPAFQSSEDSATFASEYIFAWASDLLLYMNAQRNVTVTKDIDLLVENYRKSLIMQRYEQRLLEQKLGTEITQQEIEEFYNSHSQLFVLSEPLVKGLLLKVPLNAPNLKKIRDLYKKTDDKSFEEIEKYSISYAVRYEFFYDNWMSVAQVESILPPNETPLADMLGGTSSFEIKDSEFVYFVNISEFIPAGGTEPLEQAGPEIRRLLINKNEVDFLRRIKQELYDNAVQRERIQLFNNTDQ